MSKYHAVKVTDGGYVFDSKAEHRRWCELKLMEKSGEICDIRVHERFPLVVETVRVGYYEADFTYALCLPVGAQRIVEDVKGVRTPVYKLKRKLLNALYGIEITEVEA